MMTRICFTASCVLFFILGTLIPCVMSADKPVEKRKILYYDYTYRYIHEPTIDQDGKPGLCGSALKTIAEKYHCDVICTKDGSIFEGDLNSYAAFVFYTSGELNHPGGKVGSCLSDKGRRNFLNAIENGSGFLGIHSATVHPISLKDPDPLSTAYVKMIGGSQIGHGKQQEGTILATDPVELPCLKKTGTSFRHFEEWYAMKDFNSDLHVLLLLKTEGMEGELYRPAMFPIAWVRKEGKGRVAYHALGHKNSHWSNAFVLDLTDDLLRFVLGDLDLDLTPNLQKVCPTDSMISN